MIHAGGVRLLLMDVAVAMHPWLSVIVTACEPAPRLCATGVVCDGDVFHKQEYGAVPPEGLRVAVPVLALHCVGVVETVPLKSVGAVFIVADVTAKHPFESLTV